MDASVTRAPLTFQLVAISEVIELRATSPSQFSSTSLPGISRAPGRISALASLQSCPAKKPSRSPSIPVAAPAADGAGGAATWTARVSAVSWPNWSRSRAVTLNVPPPA